MLLLRVLAVCPVLLGAALIGPWSTRGPAFRLRRHAAPGIEVFLRFRTWFVRLIGALLLIAGVLYVIHPPAHPH